VRFKLETFLSFLWKEKDAFICMGVYPPAEKVGTSKILERKNMQIFHPSKNRKCFDETENHN